MAAKRGSTVIVCVGGVSMKKRVIFVVAIFLVILIGFVEYLLLWVSALLYKDHSYKIATIMYVLCH